MDWNRVKLYQNLSNRCNLKQIDHNVIYGTSYNNHQYSSNIDLGTPKGSTRKWEMMEHGNLWDSMEALNWTTANPNYQPNRNTIEKYWTTNPVGARSGIYEISKHPTSGQGTMKWEHIDPRKSGCSRVHTYIYIYNLYRMGTHETKKILGLRCVKEIRTYASVTCPHSIVCPGVMNKINVGSTVSHGFPFYSLWRVVRLSANLYKLDIILIL